MPLHPSVSIHDVRTITIETENNPCTGTCHAYNTTRYTFRSIDGEKFTVTCFHKEGVLVESTHHRQDT